MRSTSADTLSTLYLVKYYLGKHSSMNGTGINGIIIRTNERDDSE